MPASTNLTRSQSVRRRRRTTKDPLKKTGFQLRQSLVEAIKHVVEEGAAESQNAFVERAIMKELQEVRRQRVYAAYAEAAADETFMSEMSVVSEIVDRTGSDGLDAGK